MCTADGILVPGGFGVRGTEGMIDASRWAREHKKPFLGVCLGMQMAVIDYVRSVCGNATATSEEFDQSPDATPATRTGVASPRTSMEQQQQIRRVTSSPPNHAVVFMPEIDRVNMGGTMRLGLRATAFQAGTEWSRLRALYGGDAVKKVNERHRHRYEVNPDMVSSIESAAETQRQEAEEKVTADDLFFVGRDETGARMEIAELRHHPYFVGVQFHPEYLSKVLRPSPPYLGLVAAASGCLTKHMRHGGAFTGEHTRSGAAPDPVDEMDGDDDDLF